MIHLDFTLETKEIQNLIDKSVEDDLSKTSLTTVFNQLMKEQHTQYIQANEHERFDEPTSQRNEWTTRIGNLNQEVRRREKIIRIFPNVALANRLIGAVLIDQHEEWISSSQKYIQF